jgi:hypothetical protein
MINFHCMNKYFHSPGYGNDNGSGPFDPGARVIIEVLWKGTGDYKLLLIILIRFNVRIEPLGYGRLIIYVFVSLVALLRSTFILEM